MAVVTAAVLARYLKTDVGRQLGENRMGIIDNGSCFTAAYVEDLEIGVAVFQDQHVSVDHVLNVHKIPGLPPVFVDDQR